MKTITPYIIVSSGKRHIKGYDENSSFKTQLENIVILQKHIEKKVFTSEVHYNKVEHEYARSIKRLNDLEKLSKIIKAAKENREFILIDDLRRLVVLADRNHRAEVVKDIMHAKDVLFDGRSRMLVSEFSQTHFIALGAAEKPIIYKLLKRQNSLPEKQRLQQTRRATVISQRARKQYADNKAQKLDQIRADLSKNNIKPKLREIAEKANSEGLKTTRGLDWTPQSVRQTLQRIETSEKTQKDQ